MNVYCNPCLKSFSGQQFFEHLSSFHFPASKFVCHHCHCEFHTSKSLHNHYYSYHASPQDLDLHSFEISEVFSSIEDLVKHAQNSMKCFKYAFSSSSNNVRVGPETQSLTPDSRGRNAICDSCHHLNTTVAICIYCVETFSNKCPLKQHLLNVHLQLPGLKNLINFCDICFKIFPRRDQLTEHQKKCDRDHLETSKKDDRPPVPEEIEKNKKIKSVSFCKFCNKTLANASNLRRHLLNTHSELMGVSPVSKTVYTCDYCKCYFSNKSSIKRHIVNLHLREKESKKSISCFKCEQKFNSIKNLNSHLTAEHQVQIQESRMNFASLDKFWEWKQAEELRTNARYIQLRGLRRQHRKGEIISNLKFVCNRSGIFHSKSNGKRAYRIKGSSKIGRYCSAYIEITFTESFVDCSYCSTHSGHDNDLRYLTLSMNEKKEIYDKIQNGATFPSILNEIRNNIGKEIKRKHLVTNKDLHNIVTTFKKLTKTPFLFDGENEHTSRSLDGCVKSNADIESQRTDSIEQTFNNDLEINADLWVETCQRMVNQFDPSFSLNQPKDVNVTQKCDSSAFQRFSSTDTSSHDLSYMSAGYSSDATTVNCNFISPAKYVNENENTDVLYYDDLQHSATLNYSRFDLHDYCLQNVPSAESAIEIIDNYSTTDFRTTQCAAGNREQVELPISGAFVEEFMDDAVRIKSCSPAKSDPYYDERMPSNNGEILPVIESQNDRETTDLRERVNSVTALYNIVESELDERKKKIIRDYVDNMFRVLQYRYNKCKSKKSTIKRHEQRSNVCKRLNRGKRSVRGERKKRLLGRPKAKETAACDYFLASKNSSSYLNPVSNSTSSEKPEVSMLQWKY